MFLQVSVIVFTGGVPAPGGVWSRGDAWSGGVPGGDPPSVTATVAGGTHPTGMHSCCLNAFLYLYIA